MATASEVSAKHYVQQVPSEFKMTSLVWLLNKIGVANYGEKKTTPTLRQIGIISSNTKALISCESRESAVAVFLLLKGLDIDAVLIHGNMPRYRKVGEIMKFENRILIVTEWASNSPEIQSCEFGWVIINYRPKNDLEMESWIETAGQKGCSFTLLCENDVPDDECFGAKLLNKYELGFIDSEQVKTMHNKLKSEEERVKNKEIPAWKENNASVKRKAEEKHGAFMQKNPKKS